MRAHQYNFRALPFQEFHQAHKMHQTSERVKEIKEANGLVNNEQNLERESECARREATIEKIEEHQMERDENNEKN